MINFQQLTACPHNLKYQKKINLKRARHFFGVQWKYYILCFVCICSLFLLGF